MKIEVSVGEAVDRLSILSIKKEKITDITKLSNVSKEYAYLAKELSYIGVNDQTEGYLGLIEVNKILWQIEDTVREKEFKQEFDDEFIQNARQIYRMNEARSSWKKELDKEFNSEFSEEKEYARFE